ncbi:unnamed protein product [Rotaria sp. Silwood1]|nr:unnamed protein product [Rotaria sp. Silwood1]CAF3474484.1 unnamed protein product [Rotaria sp. Silwood1]CAF3482301.1 unnamed protein product [Rotaria sp. Silwood1]CAF3499012.1 unnamed protein product [Rotaria sp. Silwood1]
MASFYSFIIILLLLSFFQPINSEPENLLISTTTSKFNLYDNVITTTTTISSIIENKTDSTSTSTSTYFNTTTTILIVNTRINSSNVPIKITAQSPPLLSSITSTIESTISDLNNNHSKKCKFLRNWQPHDDDADNTILQLEQPDIMNSQWPHQISLV